MKNNPQKVLIISPAVFTSKMAGPAIRYYWMAKALKDRVNLEIVAPAIDHSFNEFEITHMRDTKKAIKRSHIIILGSMPPKFWSSIYNLWNKKVIFDLYIPSIMEGRILYQHFPSWLKKIVLSRDKIAFNLSLELGDFFLCANPKQKNLYLEMLHAIKRSNLFLAVNSSVDRAVAIVPFGIDPKPPIHNKNSIKGVIPGIARDDKVLLWGGGIWNWFDPLTLIRAMNIISKKNSKIKLFFLGVKPPTPGMQKMVMTSRAIELSKRLGLYNKTVFFNNEWVPYKLRHNYLMESDLGLSCHFDNIETEFSFRTRILDYLWCELPIISTKGDYFAQLIQDNNLGKVVDYENPEELAEAINKLLQDREVYAQIKQNIKRIKKDYYWTEILKPVIQVCENKFPRIPKNKLKILGLVSVYYIWHIFYKLNEKQILNQ
ncbi:glycosyltransferase [Patescibacteria group bacterium]